MKNGSDISSGHVIAGIPLPASDDPLEQGFWNGLRAGVLLMQRCPRCERWYFPPRRLCSDCHFALEWTKVSGRARIWSYTAVQLPVLTAFAPYVPYCVIVAELAESKSLRLAGNVLRSSAGQINEVGIEELHVGQALELIIRPLAAEVPWPHWLLA
jgi:uncharacterized OB-fold protein